MVFVDHVGEKLLGGEIVRDRVDVEGKTDVFFRGVEDAFPARDARVVDEDGGIANFRSDAGCHCCEGGWGGDVAFVVMHIGGCGRSQYDSFGGFRNT